MYVLTKIQRHVPKCAYAHIYIHMYVKFLQKALSIPQRELGINKQSTLY